MNEAVDRVLEEREAMDRGFPAGVVMSGLAHLLSCGGRVRGVVARAARRPIIEVMRRLRRPACHGAEAAPRPGSGTRGGAAGDDPSGARSGAAGTRASSEGHQAAQGRAAKGVAAPDAKTDEAKPRSRRSPRYSGAAHPADALPSRVPLGQAVTAVDAGASASSAPRRGTPNGSDAVRDWYLAAVQQKIWVIWTRQARAASASRHGLLHHPRRWHFGGRFGPASVQSQRRTVARPAADEPSSRAAPFGPLPKTYGTNRITIQARFQPTP
jgi:hypothetical protein